MNIKQKQRMAAGLGLGCVAAALCVFLLLGPQFFNHKDALEEKGLQQVQECPAFVEKTSQEDFQTQESATSVGRTAGLNGEVSALRAKASSVASTQLASLVLAHQEPSVQGVSTSAVSRPSNKLDTGASLVSSLENSTLSVPAGSTSSVGSGLANNATGAESSNPGKTASGTLKPSPSPQPEVAKEIKTRIFSLLTNEERAQFAYPNTTNIVVGKDFAYVASSASVWNNGASEVSRAKLYTFRIQDLSLESVRDLPFAVGFNSRMNLEGPYLAITEADGSLAVVNVNDFSIQEVKQSLENAQAASDIFTFVSKGNVFFVTGSSKLDDAWKAAESELIMYNATTHERVWDAPVIPGMYWSAPYVIYNKVFVPTDGGSIVTLNGDDGSVVSTIQLPDVSSLRSQMVAVSPDTWIVTDTEGRLHKIKRTEEGDLRVEASLRFADKSTSTPRLMGTRDAFVGGLKDGKGIIVRIDVTTMGIVASAEAPAEVKSKPMFVDGDNGSYKVYFCANTNPGALYVWDGVSPQIQEAYVPEKSLQNFCMASPMLAGDYILYTNDAGAVFAVPNKPIKEQSTRVAASSENAAPSKTASSALGATETEEASATNNEEPDTPPGQDSVPAPDQEGHNRAAELAA